MQTETVTPAAATHLAVTAPATATAGAPFSFSVTALDGFGNTDTNYAGTVTFSSNDAAPVLPSDSTLTGGTGTFSATLTQAGTRTITATDTTSPAITGTSAGIVVTHGVATTISLAVDAEHGPGRRDHDRRRHRDGERPVRQRRHR